MPILYFMPWVSSSEEISVGKWVITPYERKTSPKVLSGISIAQIDSVLTNYGNQSYFPSKKISEPISRATLISSTNQSLASDPTDAEIREALQFGQEVSFSALANRSYFSNFSYCNTDGYQCIAQRFGADRTSDMAVTTRRRDGYTTQVLGDGKVGPRFVRPLHVDPRLNLDIDVELLRSLQKIANSEFRDRLEFAIKVYLRANTDAPEISEGTEVVLMRVAFESILNSSHRTQDLAKKLLVHFRDSLPNPPLWHSGEFTESIWKDRWKDCSRPLDAWANDFCAVRNAAAHGPSDTHKPTIWTTNNHLLFSCWLFPLIVKGLLNERGYFKLTDEDTALRNGLEHFFAHDISKTVSPEDRDFRWTHVERSLLWSILAKKVYG